MKIKLASGRTLTVTSTRNNKDAPWQHCGIGYKVRVSVGKLTFSFDFWDSYSNMVNRVPCDERGAASCWASDVFAGMNANTADDIASEFGYDKPSEAYRVFNGVKRAQAQAERVGISESELSELADY